MTQAVPPASDDLSRPGQQRRGSRLLGTGFWIAIAASLACILAGLGVWHYGPLVLNPNHNQGPAAEGAAPAPAAPAVGDMVTEPGADATAAQSRSAATASDSALFALRQRVANLEMSQQIGRAHV